MKGSTLAANIVCIKFMKTEARNWSSDQWYLKCWNTFALSMHAVISAKNRRPQPHRSKANSEKLGADAHQSIRDELYEWMTNQQVTGSSPLGKAINYTLGQWSKLIRYIDDGHLSIDNNRAEREIKPLVIGRINWLFSTTTNGSDASVMLDSIVETVKANGLILFDYMVKCMKKLVKAAPDLDALLPWNFKH